MNYMSRTSILAKFKAPLSYAPFASIAQSASSPQTVKLSCDKIIDTQHGEVLLIQDNIYS